MAKGPRKPGRETGRRTEIGIKTKAVIGIKKKSEIGREIKRKTTMETKGRAEIETETKRKKRPETETVIGPRKGNERKTGSESHTKTKNECGTKTETVSGPSEQTERESEGFRRRLKKGKRSVTVPLYAQHCVNIHCQSNVFQHPVLTFWLDFKLEVDQLISFSD